MDTVIDVPKLCWARAGELILPGLPRRLSAGARFDDSASSGRISAQGSEAKARTRQIRASKHRGQESGQAGSPLRICLTRAELARAASIVGCADRAPMARMPSKHRVCMRQPISCTWTSPSDSSRVGRQDGGHTRAWKRNNEQGNWDPGSRRRNWSNKRRNS